MSDSEKLALIDLMIAEFWDYNAEDQKEGARTFISAIASVINFNGKE